MPPPLTPFAAASENVREQESAGGVFSAFQFMANPASGVNDSTPRTGTTSAPSASPSAEAMAEPMGRHEAASGGLEMSAFSFLTKDSRADKGPGTPSGGGGRDLVGETEPKPESVPGPRPEGLPSDSERRTPLSSFSFLTEGGDTTATTAVEGATAVGEGDQQHRSSGMPSLPSSSSPFSVAAAAAGGSSGVLPSSADNASVGTAAEVRAGGGQQSVDGGGGEGGGGGGVSISVSGLQPPSLVSGGAASSGSGAAAHGAATVMSSGVIASEEGVPTTAAEGVAARMGTGTAVPSWKPSVGVVRKKRAARRVGYARDETPSYSSAASLPPSSPATKEPATAAGSPSPSSSPTARHVSLAKTAVGGGEASNSNANTSTNTSTNDKAGPTRPVIATAAGGGGIAYVPDGGGGGYEAPPVSFQNRTPTAPRGSGEGGAMDDSLVAEAAAMAALAASMAPGEVQEAMAKGDLKQVSIQILYCTLSICICAERREEKRQIPSFDGSLKIVDNPSTELSGFNQGLKPD